MSHVRIRLPRLAPLALVAGVLLIAGCTPQAVTSQGQQTQNLYNIVFAVATVIFFLVEGLIIYAVIRYRRKPGDNSLPTQTHGNNLLEVIWTVIPTVIVAALFVLSYQTLQTVDNVSASPQIRIQATAQRFQWSFQYLGEDGHIIFNQVTPELDVPVGQTIQLTLTSPDVIHAFYVPQFLFKRDVVPGKINVFDFNVDPSDVNQTFRGQCAELCGTYHDSMQFSVKALSLDDYKAWLAKQIADAAKNPPPAPSAAPPASGAPAPSGAAPASPGPSAGGGGGGSEAIVELEAKDIAFKQTTLTAAANAPFEIKFSNDDAGVPHNVVVHSGPDTSSAPAFDGEIITGPNSILYQIPALAPGTYAYSCKVHPTMTGTLTVQ